MRVWISMKARWAKGICDTIGCGGPAMYMGTKVDLQLCTRCYDHMVVKGGKRNGTPK